MTMRVNRETYESMIAEDLAWLHTCPDSLERQHIECVLRTSAERIYAAPPPPVLVVTDEACEIVWWYRIEHQNPSATAPMVAREWLTAWQRELGPTLGLVEIREPSDDECRNIWREAKANEGDGSKVCAGRAMFNAVRAVLWPKEGL